MLLPGSIRGVQYRILFSASILVIVTIWFIAFSSWVPSVPQLHQVLGSLSSTTVKGPVNPIVELQGIKIGGSFAIAEAGDGDAELARIKKELLQRYSNLGAGIDHVDCTINLSRYETSDIFSISQSLNKKPLSIALNLYEAEAIFPSLSLALLDLTFHLRPYHDIYISIFENDSEDLTPSLLGELAAALLTLSVQGIWFTHSPLNSNDSVERITRLAYLRNAALAPLLPIAADGMLLFINDVVTCASDLLELLHQLRLQHAHAVFSTDWESRTTFGPDPQAIFRDVWVARGINGELPYQWGPSGHTPQSPNSDWTSDLWITQAEDIHNRWMAGRPLPVYSSWNGAAAFQASLFTSLNVRFRASGPAGWEGGDASGALGEWGKLIAVPGYLDSDCPASECKLFARDVWNLFGGRARFAVAPQSRTTYTLDHWNEIITQVPPTRRTWREDTMDELINWDDVFVPESVVCVRSIDNETGESIYPWEDDNVIVKTDPMFDGYTAVLAVD